MTAIDPIAIAQQRRLRAVFVDKYENMKKYVCQACGGWGWNSDPDNNLPYLCGICDGCGHKMDKKTLTILRFMGCKIYGG